MIDYHYPVIEALRRRDGQAAAAAIMNDITLGGQAILEHVQAAA
jgi:DNA-binding GntR family transcriptional regulator